MEGTLIGGSGTFVPNVIVSSAAPLVSCGMQDQHYGQSLLEQLSIYHLQAQYTKNAAVYASLLQKRAPRVGLPLPELRHTIEAPFYRAPGLRVKRSGERTGGPRLSVKEGGEAPIRPISGLGASHFLQPQRLNAEPEGCGVLGGAAEEAEAVCRRQRPLAAPSRTSSC